MRRMAERLADEPEFTDEFVRIWREKMLVEHDLGWTREFLDRVWPKTQVQELTLAGVMDATDLRAALFAGGSAQPDDSAAGEPRAERTNGSGGHRP